MILTIICYYYYLLFWYLKKKEKKLLPASLDLENWRKVHVFYMLVSAHLCYNLKKKQQQKWYSANNFVLFSVLWHLVTKI